MVHHNEMNKIKALILLTFIALFMAACGGNDTGNVNSHASPSLDTAPVFQSASNITLQENVDAVTTVNAHDSEGAELTYGISGGADADLFEVDSRTGELHFRNAPDFETPRDSNKNNTYLIVLSASDGANTTRQTMAVSVVDDRLTVEVPAGYIKTLKLNWPAMRGITRYQLFFSSDDTYSNHHHPSDLDITTTETNINVMLPIHLTDRFNTRYLLMEGYTANGQVVRFDPLKTGQLLVQNSIGYIKASNSESGDGFGTSVALSADGQTLVVGAPGDDSAVTGTDGVPVDPTDGAGAVYVYARTGAAWIQQAYVKASNRDPSDKFGSSVALSADGQTLVVGAPNEKSAATGVDGDQGNNTAENAGAVYVYTRKETVWTQQAYLKASNTDAFDRFGTSVALSADGQTLAAGAPGEESNATGINGDQGNNAADEAGAVYVFAREGEVWAQQAYLKASNTGAIDKFGTSVGLSADGQTLVAGAPGEASAATGVDGDQGSNTANGAGAVYVYTRTGAVWSQQAYLKASNTEAYDYFGTSVALSADGQTLVAGASGESSTATGIDGDQGDNTAENAGAVYVYTRAGEVWTQQAYIKASNTDARDGFGSNVALSADGHTVVVGAPEEDSVMIGIDGDQRNNTAEKAGAVYVYTRAGERWTQQAYIKASNTQAGDYFGSSVALSAEGQTLAVGAQWENSAATGAGTGQYETTVKGVGAVYLY